MGNITTNTSEEFSQSEITIHWAYVTKIEGRVMHVLYHFEKEPENWKEKCTGKTAEVMTDDGHKLLLDCVTEKTDTKAVSCSCRLRDGHRVYNYDTINPHDIPLGGLIRGNKNSMLAPIIYAGFLLFALCVYKSR